MSIRKLWCQWVREKDLAKALHLHLKQTSSYFIDLEGREVSCKRSAKRRYAVVRYRIHRMKKDLKDKLDSSNTVQRYMCPRCGKRYSAFDALLLGSQNDEYFQCENCNGEVVPESEESADEEMGDGDNTKKRKWKKLSNMFQKLGQDLNSE